MQSVERWQLVLDRNPVADGQFVYAVRSTGVYCRPTCPSRRPGPEQVEFFDSPGEAERAGYRSCRRCVPEGTAPATEVVKRTSEYLTDNLDRRVTLAELAQRVGLSPFHLQRLFKERTGVSPREYQSALRAEKMRESLAKASGVTEAIYEAGYSSSSRFYESAGRELGMAPQAWRKGGRGQTILFTSFASALGWILLAATPKGLCFLAAGEDAKELERDLRNEFPKATVRRDEGALASHVDVILTYLADGSSHPDLPLDVQATAFQSRVWRTLRNIPPGQTRTYSDLALELGDVDLTRAVARACATNPVSLIIPCHRVVRKTGNLAGYRWGLERKKKLLALEQAAR